MDIGPFLNKLAINETETLSSYLYRLFQRNYYEAPFGIFNNEFTKYEYVQNQINEHTCKQWRVMTGQDSLYELSYKKIKIDPDKEHLLFEKIKTKCCPLCLEEKIYQDFTWGINPIYACLKHRVYLLKKCNVCKKSFTIYCLFKNKCNGCGKPLSKLKAEPITDALILESQMELIELLFGRKEKFLDLFDINDFFQVLTAFSPLFYGLNSLTQTNAPIYKSEYTNKISLSQEGMVLFLTDIYWLFQDFDARFPLFLMRVLEQEPTREVRKRRNNFESIINSNLNLRFIDEAYHGHRYEHFIRAMKFPKNIKSYDSYALHYLEENYFTAKQVKRQFGIANRELIFLMKSNSFNECFVHNGNAVYFYKDKTKKFLTSFLKEKSDRMIAAEAAELLGVSMNQVRELNKSGILVYSPYLENDKSYSKKQIKQLLMSLKPQRTNDTQNKISLSRCFDKFATSGLSLPQLLSFIRENGLLAYTQKVSYKFYDLWFDVTELAFQLKEERIHTKGYNLKQVAEELNCTERTILKYVQAGLLKKPVVEKLNNKAFAYRFNPKDIQFYKEHYLSMDEIIKEFNVSRTLVLNAVYRGAIKNYAAGICKKTVISRKEFEKYRRRTEGKVKI